MKNIVVDYISQMLNIQLDSMKKWMEKCRKKNLMKNVENKMSTMKNLKFKNSLYHLSKINKNGRCLVNFS